MTYLKICCCILAYIPALAFCADAPATTPAQKPNILVILADDLGYGDLSCQGCKDVPTPNIDSIAKNGIRFTSGYVTAPVCSPSRAGLISGRYQQRFGIDLNPGRSRTLGLPLSEKTIAERLKAQGYTTGMFGKWHLGFPLKMQPTHRGFDEYFGFLGAAHSYLDIDDNDKSNAIIRGTQRVTSMDYLTDALGREATGFIEKNHDKPWFVYLAFNATHGPYQATAKYTSRFPNITDPGRRTFAAMDSALDDAIGMVLAKIRQHNLEENTLIFFLSDNGAPNHKETKNSNLPLRGYKNDLLEGGIREPFLVQWKGHLPAGKVDDRPVISLDITPTALAAAGGPIDPKLEGVNLLPYLTGEKSDLSQRALFWHFSYMNQHAARIGDWKLLVQGQKVQLYNLANDIGEKNNLAAKEPQKLKEMEAAYQKWNAQNSSGKGKGRNKAQPKAEPGNPE